MEKKKLKTNDKATLKEVLELHRLEEQFKAYKRSYEERKKELQTSISNYMFVNGFGMFDFKSREFGSVKVNKIVRKTIVWDVDKLKENLPSEVFNQISEKQYVIEDMQGLIKYLKSCGVTPKKFKKYLTVETKIIDSKVNELSEVGDITEEDIDGCYKLKEASPYLRIDVKPIEREE